MEKFLKEKQYKLTRKDMIFKVSVIIQMIVAQFMDKVMKEYDMRKRYSYHYHFPDNQKYSQEEVKEASLLFNEIIYSRSKWTVDTVATGLASTGPLFLYSVKEVLEDDE